MCAIKSTLKNDYSCFLISIWQSFPTLCCFFCMANHTKRLLLATVLPTIEDLDEILWSFVARSTLVCSPCFLRVTTRQMWRTQHGEPQTHATFWVTENYFIFLSHVEMVVTISRWLNSGRPAPPRGGLWWGEIFWLCLTTASAQCLRLIWALFYCLLSKHKFLLTWLYSSSYTRMLRWCE